MFAPSSHISRTMSVSNHGYLGYLVVMSQKFWKSLSPELQANVLQAMKESTAKERELAIELDKKQFAEIEKYAKETKKIVITKLTPEQISAWRTEMEKIYPEFYDDRVIGKSLIEAARNTK